MSYFELRIAPRYMTQSRLMIVSLLFFALAFFFFVRWLLRFFSFTAILRLRRFSWSQWWGRVLANPLTRFVISKKKISAQARAAERGLPQLIDLVRLNVVMGHNLEGALRRSAVSLTGYWGKELRRLVGRLDAGVNFDEAFSNVVERCRLPAFTRLVMALKQSRLLGASLAGTLQVQATLLRARRKQRAEELARTAAVKIALPLVLCIFPALMIIYLAPAILQLLSGL